MRSFALLGIVAFMVSIGPLVIESSAATKREIMGACKIREDKTGGKEACDCKSNWETGETSCVTPEGVTYMCPIEGQCLEIEPPKVKGGVKGGLMNKNRPTKAQ